MDYMKAVKRARELMNEHGLEEWHLKLSHGKRRLGSCVYDTRTINLSRHLIRLNTEAEVEDVILHEVAHALAGPRAGHGRAWKVEAARIGARPRRCAGPTVRAPKGRWVGTCVTCGVKIRRHRRVRGLCHTSCRRAAERDPMRVFSFAGVKAGTFTWKAAEVAEPDDRQAVAQAALTAEFDSPWEGEK